MIDFLKLLVGSLVGLFRSHAAREAEMAFLRQQLFVLKRSAPARVRLRTADRLIFVWLYRLVEVRWPTVQPAFWKPGFPTERSRPGGRDTQAYRSSKKASLS